MLTLLIVTLIVLFCFGGGGCCRPIVAVKLWGVFFRGVLHVLFLLLVFWTRSRVLP